MPWYEACALGCAGGALPDMLRLISFRYDAAPEYLLRKFFWISLALLIALGGITSALMTPSRAVDALAIGFSAPAILSRVLGGERETKSLDDPRLRAESNAQVLREHRNEGKGPRIGGGGGGYMRDELPAQVDHHMQANRRGFVDSLRLWWAT
jgi:hypothetical protein